MSIAASPLLPLLVDEQTRNCDGWGLARANPTCTLPSALGWRILQLPVCLGLLCPQPAHITCRDTSKPLPSVIQRLAGLGLSICFCSAHGQSVWGKVSEEERFVLWKFCGSQTSVGTNRVLREHSPAHLSACCLELPVRPQQRWMVGLDRVACEAWNTVWSFPEKFVTPWFKHCWADGNKWGPSRWDARQFP